MDRDKLELDGDSEIDDVGTVVKIKIASLTSYQ